jgi:hypothetical protein
MNFNDEYNRLYHDMMSVQTKQKYKYKHLIKSNKNTDDIDTLIFATLEYSAAKQLNLKPPKKLLKTMWKNFKKHVSIWYYGGEQNTIASAHGIVKRQHDLIDYLTKDKGIELPDLEIFYEKWWEWKWEQERNQNQ